MRLVEAFNRSSVGDDRRSVLEELLGGLGEQSEITVGENTVVGAPAVGPGTYRPTSSRSATRPGIIRALDVTDDA